MRSRTSLVSAVVTMLIIALDSRESVKAPADVRSVISQPMGRWAWRASPDLSRLSFQSDNNIRLETVRGMIEAGKSTASGVATQET